jgi:ribosome maturation factor RimP
MVNIEKVRQLITEKLGGTAIVLVDLQISPSNQIKVLLDSFEGVTISKCVEISRLVEGSLDRDEEDFELEVSSYGISQSFVLPLHYLKNIERQVEVFYKDGRSIKGTLSKVELTENKQLVRSIEIYNKKKVKQEGKKKKVVVEEITSIAGDEIQKARLVPIF